MVCMFACAKYYKFHACNETIEKFLIKIFSLKIDQIKFVKHISCRVYALSYLFIHEFQLKLFSEIIIT